MGATTQRAKAASKQSIAQLLQGSGGLLHGRLTIASRRSTMVEKRTRLTQEQAGLGAMANVTSSTLAFQQAGKWLEKLTIRRGQMKATNANTTDYKTLRTSEIGAYYCLDAHFSL